MDGRQDNASAISNQLNDAPLTTSSTKANSHCFRVHCLSETRILNGKIYESVDSIKKDAYQLYKDGSFNDDNAILTHPNEQNEEILLNSVPDLATKDLFIRFVRPICAMCSNPFGIVDNQLLLQCSEQTCGEQYCSSCVQAVRGSPAEHRFVCITCKNYVTPERNLLIEKYIIWKSMCQLYGIQSLLDLKEDSSRVSCHSLLQNIELRRIHLRSRLNTVKNRMARQYSIHSTDEQLITDVNQLCSNLTDLVDEIKRTDQEMHRRGIIVGDCLEKYKKAIKHFDDLCHALVEAVIQSSTVDNNNTSNVSPDHEQHIQDLDQLSSEQNIRAIDRILVDIDFRYKYLSSHVEKITSLLNNQPDRMKPLKKDLERANKMLETMPIVEEELKYLRQCLQAIDGYTDDYDKLLRDDQFSDIPCSKFILLMERMRVRTEELEILNIFLQTGQAMKAWQNDFGTDEEFKPKAIDLFKAIEQDLQNLFTDYNWIYSVPYKVGVIGGGSVGKSASVVKLAQKEEFSSMIAIERSTFGYLQFDTLIYEDPRNGKIIPITFIDIEGATDTDQFVSIGNYLELINKADCDMYIIVFDDFFSGHNRTCQKHIENNLKRKCVLVRSKADVLFNQYFQEATKKKYQKTVSEDYDTKIALSETRNHALRTFDDKSLKDKVYLTATVCEDNLKDAPFAEFDLNVLKKKLVEMALTDVRVGRICKLVILASRAAVNTCFRRGYAVTQAIYKWLAAGASLIPLLNEFASFSGREKIRQAFGIHDRCAIANAVFRTKDSFEEYLTEKQLTVPKQHLVSGEFKYLKDREIDEQAMPTHGVRNKRPFSENISTSVGPQVLTNAGGSFIVLGAVGTVADDAARALAPTAIATLRTVSIAGIVIGAALTPLFATWSFYSAGRSMNKELHSICDDLVIVLQYFAVDRCNGFGQNIQPPIIPSSGGDSSSDEEPIDDLILCST